MATRFSKKLKEATEAKGISQCELAKYLNTNHPIIGKYERDKVAPSIADVKNLAAALDTTVGYLLRERKIKLFKTYCNSEAAE